MSDISDDIYWIKPNLGIMPHPMGGRALAYDIKRLKKLGVDTLVSLLSHMEANHVGLNKEKNISKKANLKFIHFPLVDGTAPPQDERGLRLVDDITRDYKSGKKVVIHCWAGIGRSGSLATAVLLAAGDDPLEAIRLVRQKRGKMIPETEEQMKWLQWVYFQKNQ